MVAVGKVLVAAERQNAGHTAHLLSSDDGGRHWTRVVLPGAPRAALLNLQPRLATNEVAVVTARESRSAVGTTAIPSGAAFVWTTVDGKHWRSHTLATDVPRFYGVDVQRVGDLLVLGVTSERTFLLFSSTDRGRTWRRSAVPQLALDPNETAHLIGAWSLGGETVVQVDFRAQTRRSFRRPELASRDGERTWALRQCSPRPCPRILTAGRLATRGTNVSLDGGRTWSKATFLPSEASSEPPSHFLDLIELDAGGWLATGWLPGSDSGLGYLLRSDDGRTWQRLLAPDPCVELGGSRPNSEFTRPVLFGDRWYVAYNCSSLVEPLESQIFASDISARHFVPVTGTRRRGPSFGQPVLLDDRLLIPEEGGSYRLFEIGRA
jgi:photosystem II stability/assembly factor-like uncharacterized protein